MIFLEYLCVQTYYTLLNYFAFPGFYLQVGIISEGERARQVDELFHACFKQIIETHQGKDALYRIERVMQEQKTHVTCKYQELVGHLTTDLCNLQLENRTLIERTNQPQVDFQTSQETTAACLVDTNRINDQVAQMTIEVTEKTAQIDRVMETNAVLSQEMARLKDEVARLTTGVTEMREQRDREMEDSAQLRQEVATFKGQMAWSTNEVTEKTEQNNRLMETNAVLSHKVTRLNDQVDQLTTEVTEKTEQKDKIKETNAMLNQEVTKLKDEVARLTTEVTEMGEHIQKSHDSNTSLTTEKNDLMLKVRSLTDKKDLLMETHNKAVAVLTQQVDELTEANKGLVKNKEVQDDSLAVLEIQNSQLKAELEKEKGAVSVKAEHQAQLEHMKSIVSGLRHELDKVKIEKAKAEKLLEEANEAKETEKQQVDEMMHQIQVELTRAKDENRSLVAQVTKLTEKRKEERKRFKYELSLEQSAFKGLQEELATLARKYHIKELEDSRKDAVRAMAESKKLPLEYRSLPNDPDSGVPPSSPSN